MNKQYSLRKGNNNCWIINFYIDKNYTSTATIENELLASSISELLEDGWERGYTTDEIQEHIKLKESLDMVIAMMEERIIY